MEGLGQLRRRGGDILVLAYLVRKRAYTQSVLAGTMGAMAM